MNKIKIASDNFSEAFSEKNFAEAKQWQKVLEVLIESLEQKVPIQWEKFDFKENIQTDLNIGTVLPLVDGGFAVYGRDSLGWQKIKIWHKTSNNTYEKLPDGNVNLKGSVSPMIKLREGNLVTGASYGTVTFRDKKDGEYLFEFQCKAPGDVKALLETKNEEIVVATGSNTVEVWDVKQAESLIKKTFESSAGVTAMVEGGDGRIWTGNESGFVEAWDIGTESSSEPSLRIEAYKSKVNAMIETSDGLIATAGISEVKLWDSKTGELVDLVTCFNSQSLEEDTDGSLILSGLGGTKVWKRNARHAEPPRNLVHQININNDVVNTISQALVDKTTFLTADDRGLVRIYGVDEKDERKK